jgi:hypothetical protein
MKHPSAWAFLFLLALLPVACVQTENSNTLDKDNYGSSGLTAQAKAIFSSKCTPCHSFQGESVDQLVSEGLMVIGDPENSKLFYRLQGSSGVNGPKDMPSGSSISAGDVALIYSWVLSPE